MAAEGKPEIESRFTRRTTLGGKSSEQGNTLKTENTNEVIPERGNEGTREKGEKVDIDGNVQRTIYFDPEQWRKLRKLRRQIEDEIDETPNVQDMLRYLVATATIDRFSGFADFLAQENLKRKQKRQGK